MAYDSRGVAIDPRGRMGRAGMGMGGVRPMGPVTPREPMPQMSPYAALAGGMPGRGIDQQDPRLAALFARYGNPMMRKRMMPQGMVPPTPAPWQQQVVPGFPMVGGPYQPNSYGY